MNAETIEAAINRAATRTPRAFSRLPFARINGRNPDGLPEKTFRSSKTGEIFRYVWNNGEWEIYDEVPA